jgi:LysR family transcriptional activator of nhaA
MEWINYHHLLYFYFVAREGSISKAAQQLRLAQPTVSAQIKSLEESLGAKLFERRGRQMVLTETGQLVFRYADEIFAVGKDLIRALEKGSVDSAQVTLRIGVADVLPKIAVHRLIEPAMRLADPVVVVCQEGKSNELLERLAVYELDLVLTDAPASGQSGVRTFNHLLGECGISVFGTRRLAKLYGGRFPNSISGAPFLFPSEHTALRMFIDHWFSEQKVTPRVVGVFSDSALLKTFGQQGYGLFIMPTAVEAEVQRQFRVEVLGRIESIRARFYAITVQRRIRHPAVLAITQAARDEFLKE